MRINDISFFYLDTGIRLFDGVSVEPKHIVRGFRYKRDVIDIYSNSWGPADNGYTTRRPKPRMQRALEDGVKFVSTNLFSIWFTYTHL
jgi:hypothetical protein